MDRSGHSKHRTHPLHAPTSAPDARYAREKETSLASGRSLGRLLSCISCLPSAVLRKFGYDNHLRLGPEAFGGLTATALSTAPSRANWPYYADSANAPESFRSLKAIPDPFALVAGDVSFTRALEQCVELTDASLHFLESAFAAADTDRDGLLSAEELEELFSTAPGSPICELGWPSVPGPDDKVSGEREGHRALSDCAYAEAKGAFRLGSPPAPRVHAWLARCRSALSQWATKRFPRLHSYQGMPLNSFLANWALAALLRPQVALAYLLYLGLPCHPHDALKVSRRRKAERKRRRHGRSVLQCFVIGSTDGGRLSFVDDEHSSVRARRRHCHFAAVGGCACGASFPSNTSTHSARSARHRGPRIATGRPSMRMVSAPPIGSPQLCSTTKGAGAQRQLAHTLPDGD